MAEYNELHAKEWMEKHPYGYYNNEDDYGEDIDDWIEQLANKLDEKNIGAELFDDGDMVYIECVKAIKPVKLFLETNKVKIKKEYECEGSDYPSYIIELDINR